nr:transporter substrate-binding domain-containing protein [Salinivibrio sp. IB574]
MRLTNGEFAPLTSVKMKHGGVFSHIVTEALASSGYQVEYGFFPWKRAFVMAKNGQWDGSVTWGFRDEFTEDFSYSEPVFTIYVYLYHRKNFVFNWQEDSDLEGVKLGVNRGYLDEYMLNQMQKRGLNITYQSTTTELQNFRALLSGRVDVVISAGLIAERLVRDNFTKSEQQNIAQHPRPFRVTPLHVLISRKIDHTEEFTSAINRGLEALRESGRYQALLDEFEAGGYE